jgi:hypothetical protein
MRAYYFDNVPGDQRLPHDYVPSRPVAPETLSALKLPFWHIPVEGHEDAVNAIAKERGYKNRDTINVSKEGMGAVYEEKIRGFFEEHMHEDEEIRYILSGSGFFDVRGAFLSCFQSFLALYPLHFSQKHRPMRGSALPLSRETSLFSPLAFTTALQSTKTTASRPSGCSRYVDFGL